MIAIIAAMDSEVNAITNIMEHCEKTTVSGISIARGVISGKKVIVMKSGVGKVNAAMSTTILLENFVIDKIINIGTAGGLKKEQEILDAVISDRVVQHDFDTSPVDGEDGIGLYFDADEALCKTCADVFAQMNVRAHVGLVATGDQFIAQEDQLSRLEETFPLAICAEMEAGAIASVATHYHVPFVVLRSLSDIAHRDDSHMDFLTYVEHAAARSATFCKEVMNFL